MMKTIGIIGSAFRMEDAKYLTPEIFYIMRSSVRNIIATITEPHEDYRLVSGGASGADHVAVSLFLLGEARRLTLHFPCKFYPEHHMFGYSTPEKDEPAVSTINHYHSIFSDITWLDKGQLHSRWEIAEALETGAEFTVSNGFFARNTLIARDAEYMIALTFGEGARLKDGGTKDTMKKFLMKKDPRNSYHVDLNNYGRFNPAVI